MAKSVKISNAGDSEFNVGDVVLKTELAEANESVEQEDGWASLSEMGSQLSKLHSDFDPRNYGVSKLSKLIEKTGQFHSEPEGRSILVRLKGKGRN